MVVRLVYFRITPFMSAKSCYQAQRPASPVAPMNLPRQRRRRSRHLVHAFVGALELFTDFLLHDCETYITSDNF
jgi:hypothetical protein